MAAVATGVPSPYLAVVWPQVWPLIAPAYELDPERPDLIAGIRERRFTLWAVYDRNEAIAGIVVRQGRARTSSERLCRIYLVGGSRMSEWAGDFIAKLIPWARSEGCVALTGAGRRGWGRIVRRFGGYPVVEASGLPAWRLDIAEAAPC